MEIIHKRNEITFGVATEFNSKYLTPIIKNLLYKAENEWDDYNEVYHCTNLIEKVKKNKDMKMDFHVMLKDGEYVGIALVTSGIIDYKTFFNESITLNDENKNDVLIFNYFHISQEGRGNGQIWFRDVIIPYYQSEKYKTIYVKSSHEKVFTIYNRIGTEIGEYTSNSDNQLFVRKGKVFKIKI
ncbi:hypothetical protein JOD29_003059 [Lysinibacillus composti]|uniref:GNAT family N-acetyltransferase n=1 Tax=Lysinibacillus composti TaxID=720633 RepID=A0A3N9UM12_9BACI|nr:hypothetical protein [Lysinibacillus composti]MBM7609783.1 hypothetical protein [Lysinibacillus composti]RQW73562.1 hypothetical protein EBB45_15750 [Lysinibacillus composti]